MSKWNNDRKCMLVFSDVNYDSQGQYRQYSMNLQSMMGSLLWNNFDGFMLKFEAFGARNVAGVTFVQLFISTDSLVWTSRYLDTRFADKRMRMLCAVRVSQFDNFKNGTVSFPSNTFQHCFLKPQDPKVVFRFYTATNADALDTTFWNNAETSMGFLLSVCGNPRMRKNIIGRELVLKDRRFATSRFVLNTTDATKINSIESKMRFSNINIEQIIGRDFRRYTHFNLSLKHVAIQGVPAVTFSGYHGCFIFMSGLDWECKNSNVVSNTDLSNHKDKIQCVGMNIYNNQNVKDVYFNNVFRRGKSVVELTLTINSVANYTLALSSGTMPPSIFVFDILLAIANHQT